MIGINAELGGILPNPSNGTLGVFDAFLGRDALSGLYPVIGPSSDHATTGEIIRLRFKLLDRPHAPSAPEEEHDCGPPVALLPILRIVDDHLKIDLLDLLVGQ